MKVLHEELPTGEWKTTNLPNFPFAMIINKESVEVVLAIPYKGTSGESYVWDTCYCINVNTGSVIGRSRTSVVAELNADHTHARKATVQAGVTFSLSGDRPADTRDTTPRNLKDEDPILLLRSKRGYQVAIPSGNFKDEYTVFALDGSTVLTASVSELIQHVNSRNYDILEKSTLQLLSVMYPPE